MSDLLINNSQITQIKSVSNGNINPPKVVIKQTESKDEFKKKGSEFVNSTAFKVGLAGLAGLTAFLLYRGNVSKVQGEIADITTKYSGHSSEAPDVVDEAAEVIQKGAKKIFHSIEEASSYLMEKFGIESEFINPKQANLVVDSVEDFCSKNSPDMFKGMKVGVYEAPPSELGRLHFGFDYANNKVLHDDLAFNKNFDWDNVEKITQDCAEKSHWPAADPKTEVYHELGHWLDFKNNPRNYAQQYDNFVRDTPHYVSNGFCTFVENYPNKYINDTGLARCSKVSNYAKTSPLEFKAEYIAGRMSGKQYSQDVNDMYAEFDGPNLIF